MKWTRRRSAGGVAMPVEGCSGKDSPGCMWLKVRSDPLQEQQQGQEWGEAGGSSDQ